MIVTKKPQLVDAKNGIQDIVYINISNQHNNSKEVVFDVECFSINYKELEVEKDRYVMTDEGLSLKVVKEKIIVPDIKSISNEKAVFSAETYRSKVGVFNPADFETSFLQQLDFLKTFDWSKTDTKPIGYWGLGSKDVKIISNEEFKVLITNKKVK